tara:strand:+ start:630 stop:740 length:111 start_codon:yes stop_codon:yes gene_type:complete
MPMEMEVKLRLLLVAHPTTNNPPKIKTSSDFMMQRD